MVAQMLGSPPSFQDGVKTTEGMTKFFSWMTEQQAVQKQVKLKAEGAGNVSALVRAPIGLAEDALREHLISLKVDVSKFGKSSDVKTLKEFSQELIKGESTLTQDESGKVS